MIKQEELERLGFKNDGVTKSPYTGKLRNYHLDKDSGHAIPMHDRLGVDVYLDHPFVTIEVEHESSHTYTKEVCFKGWCEDIKLFEKILIACCKYYS